MSLNKIQAHRTSTGTTSHSCENTIEPLHVPADILHCPHWSPDLRGWWDNGDRSLWQTHRVERKFLIWRTFPVGSLRTALWSHRPHPQTLPCSAEDRMQKNILINTFLKINQQYLNPRDMKATGAVVPPPASASLPSDHQSRWRLHRRTLYRIAPSVCVSSPDVSSSGPRHHPPSPNSLQPRRHHRHHYSASHKVYKTKHHPSAKTKGINESSGAVNPNPFVYLNTFFCFRPINQINCDSLNKVCFRCYNSII